MVFKVRVEWRSSLAREDARGQAEEVEWGNGRSLSKQKARG